MQNIIIIENYYVSKNNTSKIFHSSFHNFYIFLLSHMLIENLALENIDL